MQIILNAKSMIFEYTIQTNVSGYAALDPKNFPHVMVWHGKLSKRPAFAEHVLPRFS